MTLPAQRLPDWESKNCRGGAVEAHCDIIVQVRNSFVSRRKGAAQSDGKNGSSRP